MQPVLAFDVYGTLIDTLGVTIELERRLSDASKAGEFAKRWREKQLEYSFRHSLMGAYVPFAECSAGSITRCRYSLRGVLERHRRGRQSATDARWGEEPYGRRGECRCHQALQARPGRLCLSPHAAGDATGSNMVSIQ